MLSSIYVKGQTLFLANNSEIPISTISIELEVIVFFLEKRNPLAWPRVQNWPRRQMRQDTGNKGKYIFSDKNTYFVTYRLVCKSQNKPLKGGYKSTNRTVGGTDKNTLVIN